MQVRSDVRWISTAQCSLQVPVQQWELETPPMVVTMHAMTTWRCITQAAMTVGAGSAAGHCPAAAAHLSGCAQATICEASNVYLSLRVSQQLQQCQSLPMAHITSTLLRCGSCSVRPHGMQSFLPWLEAA